MTASCLTRTRATWLLIGQVHDDEPVRHIRIESSPFRVGRRNNLALTIARPTISSVHAELVVDGDSLRVRDLGSTNGTFINGVRIHAEYSVGHGDLIQFADVVFRAGLEVAETFSKTITDDASNRALALIQFDRLMAERAVVPFFQPLVSLRTLEIQGYEVLARTRLFGLCEAKTIFMAAAVLNAEAELSRMFRTEGVRVGSSLPGKPNLFLNTHPAELTDTGLLEFSLRELREIHPTGAITLEIHEGVVTGPDQMQELRRALADMNIGLAYDDFGAGQARLVELAEAPPDYLKFDLHLIHGIQSAHQQRQRMLESLVRMAQDLGIVTVAEGIETLEEHEVCRQIGFELGQGFFYGKPAAVKQYASRAEKAE